VRSGESCGGRYGAVVIGGSAGSLEVLAIVLSALPSDFPMPVLLVHHLHPSDDGGFSNHLARGARIPVIEPCDKERIEPGRVYVAPANYHMLVERCGAIALSVDERVNWSRPSIDVLFESAAAAWGSRLIAVILSGASADGARGMLAIKTAGGLTIAQEPAGAEYPVMPLAAIEMGAVDKVLRPAQIGQLLVISAKVAKPEYR
jgi:two-component system, chemotaxis family, protein-glutamate methylesterase/glutaminase